MSNMDERKKAFEGLYERSQELQFKAEMRRNRKLGNWAAAQFGLSGDEADSYVAHVIESDFEKPGDDDVVEAVMADFKERGLDITENRLRIEMEKFLTEAKAELMEDS